MHILSPSCILSFHRNRSWPILTPGIICLHSTYYMQVWHVSNPPIHLRPVSHLSVCGAVFHSLKETCGLQGRLQMIPEINSPFTDNKTRIYWSTADQHLDKILRAKVSERVEPPKSKIKYYPNAVNVVSHPPVTVSFNPFLIHRFLLSLHFAPSLILSFFHRAKDGSAKRVLLRTPPLSQRPLV